MRYDKAHKDESRARIVANASARFRRDGIGSVGLRALVGDAGLTHGAFYSHFPSKSDLVAESVASALNDTHGYFERKTAEVPSEERLEVFVDKYLDMRHRRDPHLGCAGAALAPEVAREAEAVRRSFMSGIDRLVTLISEILPPGGHAPERATRARSIFAGMMGSLQLSRVADDDKAVAILAEARQAALASARQPWIRHN